jgi:hypothetical protein
MEGEPSIDIVNELKTYTWTIKDVPASSKENYQVNGQLDAPRLLCSTDDLKTVYLGFVSQDAFDLQTNTQMDELVSEVMKEYPDQMTAALAFQKIVSNNLDNLNIPLEFTGFICRSPIDTWNSNQGTALEKALLLCALLQKANIHATPVAIIPNELFDQQIGDLLSFKDFALMVEPQNTGKVLISSNQIDNQNQIFKVTNQKLVKLDNNLKSPGLYTIDKRSNQILATATFHLNDIGLSGKMNLEMQAAANPYFSLIKDASTVKSFVKGGVSAKDIDSFTQVELSQEKSWTLMEIKKENPFDKLQNYLFFELPYIMGGVQDWHYNLLTAERNSAIEIPEAIHEKYVYTIAFSDDLKLVSKPTDIDIKNDAGHLLIRFEKLDGTLIVTREVKFSKKIIDVDMYDGYREIMNAWGHDNFQKIIFKKN